MEIQQEQTLNQLAILDYMYSKHLVSPSNIMKLLEDSGKYISLGITVEDIVAYDQDHLGGIDATKTCLNLLSINASSRVLDVGSGLGGPSRYLAYKTGCLVTGVEIQPDRFNIAGQITSAVNLTHLVSFLNDDFNSVCLPKAYYSHAISFLSLLHIIHKQKAIKKIGNSLFKGGKVFVEDYYRMNRLSQSDKSLLLETISCPNLMSLTSYIEAFEEADIRISDVVDMSDSWKNMVEKRVDSYEENLVTLSKVVGLDSALNALTFAEGVAKIFNEGLIGGVRLIGEKI